MCGICGIINLDKQPVKASNISLMMQTMKHRGPDDEGSFIDDNIGLGFVRLSIIDLSKAGNQPMISRNNRYVIVFNGEIFNYLELKEELKANYNFVSETDTEVILAAYIEWGNDCVDKFNGMWAFVIYDNVEKSFFISRDRFGIKPFYYFQDLNQFVFASDIPSILSVLKVKPGPDNQSIYDYLVYNRTNYSERTFFEGIKKLPHSHNLIIKNNTFKLHRWYNLKDNLIDGFKNPNEFKNSLLLSIKQQLRSDVPIGACLSGGLDSSTIVSLVMNNFVQPAINTFSAVYEKGQIGDESDFINEYQDIIKNIHKTKPTELSLLSDLDTFVEAMVEPIPGTSEYAEFKVMELANKHCKVILNGQGADEEMAGYLMFFGYYFKELLYRKKILKLIKEIFAYRRIHKSIIGVSSFFYYLIPSYLKDMKWIVYKKYISKSFFNEHHASKELSALYNSKTLNESLLNHFEYKFEHQLCWADRSGMWFSIETRFPFLDHRFVEQVLALSSDKMIGDGITKRILRDSMKGVLPEKIRMRMDKVGYETPENDWFRNPEFQVEIKKIINSESFKNRKYFDQQKIEKLYDQHLLGKINIGKEIWKWIHLELWLRKYID